MTSSLNHFLIASRLELTELHAAVMTYRWKVYHLEGNHEAMETIILLKKAFVGPLLSFPKRSPKYLFLFFDHDASLSGALLIFTT